MIFQEIKRVWKITKITNTKSRIVNISIGINHKIYDWTKLQNKWIFQSRVKKLGLCHDLIIFIRTPLFATARVTDDYIEEGLPAANHKVYRVVTPKRLPEFVYAEKKTTKREKPGQKTRQKSKTYYA